MKQWVELFHGPGRPYLLLGRMLRPPKLLVPAATDGDLTIRDIRLNAFQAPDGSAAAIVVNASAEDRDVHFRWRGTSHALRLAPWSIRLVPGGPGIRQ